MLTNPPNTIEAPVDFLDDNTKQLAAALTLDAYQRIAAGTNAYEPDDTELAMLSIELTTEVGEAVDVLKRFYRGEALNRGHLKEELGDVLWAVAAIAEAADIPLEAIARFNIDKLAARKAAQSLHDKGKR